MALSLKLQDMLHAAVAAANRPSREHYLPDQVYDNLVDALEEPLAGMEFSDYGDARSFAVAVLGEVGGIWPQRVEPA